jgi:hypothetical protein
MIWTMLLRLAIGFLADLVASFVRNLRSARLDDPSVVAVIDRIVRGIAVDHPDWTGEQKRARAADSAKIYLANMGKDIADSLLNTILELSVQKLKDKG